MFGGGDKDEYKPQREDLPPMEKNRPLPPTIYDQAVQAVAHQVDSDCRDHAHELFRKSIEVRSKFDVHKWIDKQEAVLNKSVQKHVQVRQLPQLTIDDSRSAIAAGIELGIRKCRRRAQTWVENPEIAKDLVR